MSERFLDGPKVDGEVYADATGVHRDNGDFFNEPVSRRTASKWVSQG